MLWLPLLLTVAVRGQVFEVDCELPDDVCGAQTVAASKCLTPCFQEAQGCFRAVGTVITKIQQCMLDLGEDNRNKNCNTCIENQMDAHCDNYFEQREEECGPSNVPVPTKSPTESVCFGLNRKKCAQWEFSCMYVNGEGCTPIEVDSSSEDEPITCAEADFSCDSFLKDRDDHALCNEYCDAAVCCTVTPDNCPACPECPKPEEPECPEPEEPVCDVPCGVYGRVRKHKETSVQFIHGRCECSDFCEADDENTGWAYKIPKTGKQIARGGECTCFSGKKVTLRIGKKDSTDIAGLFGY